MKNLINEILEEIGLEKIKINHQEAKANKEPLEVNNKKHNININIAGERKKFKS